MKPEFMNTVFAVILALTAFGAAFIQLLKSHKTRVMEMLKEENEAVSKRLDSLEKENERLRSENETLTKVAMLKVVPEPLREFLEAQHRTLCDQMERNAQTLAKSLESIVGIAKSIQTMAESLVGEMKA